MASAVYNNFKEEVMEAVFNLATDSCKVALVTATYTVNVDSHTTYADLTNEVTGTGYTAGGAALSSPTVTQDDTDDEGVFDAADTSWATSSITARAAVIYDTTASNKLICYVDFGANYTTVGGTFQITWATEGIINIG